MQEIVNKINELKKQKIAKEIALRYSEFQSMKNASNNAWFSELCFCILTANSTAQKGIQIQQALGAKGFLTIPKKLLVKKLKALGHRFYNKRAEFIVKVRSQKKIKKIITGFSSAFVARDWLAENVLGIGYKEASHFLRNVGFDDLAILDRHILSLMQEHSMIEEKPKTLNRTRYLLAEEKLSVLAKKVCLSQSELDLFLWFLKTGKVLK